MDSLFGRKKTLKEQVKDNDRDLRKANREVERDRKKLEMEEKKLEQEIKKAAKSGNKQVCTLLAKQLVNLRKQKNRTFVASSQISAAGYAAKGMVSNVKIAEAMGETSRTMGQMNKAMDPKKLAGTLRDFTVANDKMNMTEEVMNDAFDDILGESDDEAEEQGVINKVLDEIGIEISGKMINAPSAGKDTIGESTKTTTKEDREIEEMLAQLKA
uniref:Charged multivesicular body protein 2b n=1 Tax=Lepeophtheirus salmonis TaxID=72036 RepID=C1BS85_LEPSM|nr:Charged multivesicular body protein 2b [Lepeophtheirus salmonis]